MHQADFHHSRFQMKHPFALLTALLLTPLAMAQDKAHLQLESPFASYVEADFPFFTQTVDARKFGPRPQPGNLTPRGILMCAGNGLWGCFDPDLLRWALIWQANAEGEYLSMDGMGTGSYRLPSRKAAPGQAELPHPIGTPLATLPPQPGIGIGDAPSLQDPRGRGEAEEGESGLGPLPEALGRFNGIRLVNGGAQLEYTIGRTRIRERFMADGGSAVRWIEIGPREARLHVRAGPRDADWLSVPASKKPTIHRIVLSPQGTISLDSADAFPATQAPARRWQTPVTPGAITPAAKDAPWVFDDLPLPLPNPWKRNVRPVDLELLADGRAVVLTFDGDVWMVDGLGTNAARWSRFASGLHEPQSLCLVDGVIHVFDRNGIVRLHDTDGNGEADWHENFSDIVAQSAETRNYPMDIIAAREGGFYLALGGQVGTTIGKSNGVVVKVAADGRAFEVIASGLRQPYLGYDAETGLLTATDQQGNWKPATPVYRIEKGRYFGFQPEKFGANPVHPAPIAPAELWIPHFIHQSAASQVWIRARDGREPAMGALNGSLVHLAYSRPEIFKIYLDADGGQGAVMPLLSGFPSALLNGRVHPRDGLLYLAGFQISGFPSVGSRVGGIYRVRPGRAPGWLPREIRAEKRGILMRFDAPLSAELVTQLGRYSADRWNYHQAHLYGSGNYRTDNDQPGQEAIAISSARLSIDGKSIFLGIAAMRPAQTLRLTYRLPAPGVEKIENAYLTMHSLPSLDLTAHGFDTNEVDLTPRGDLAAAGAAIQPTAALGKEVAVRYACIACHLTGDPSLPAPPAAALGAKTTVGPPWTGLWNAPRTFADGSNITNADGAYIRESILDPARRVQAGYEPERTGAGMPSYLGVLKDHEIDSLILFIKTLHKTK
jgi:hypothetical protein